MPSFGGGSSGVGATVEVGEIESLPKGSIIVGDGDGAPAIFPVGATGQAIVADPTAALGVRYSDVGGSGSGPAYTHDQDVASATWTITHELGRQPNVVVVVGDEVVEGVVSFLDSDTAVVEFASAQAGLAYCY